MNISKYLISNQLFTSNIKNSLQYFNYATLTPFQKILKEKKKEWNATRNSVILHNFTGIENIEKLKNHITPSLLEKSTERTYQYSNGIISYQYSFNNRNDTIQFCKEANQFLDQYKEEYLKTMTEKANQIYKSEKEKRVARIKEYYINQQKAEKKTSKIVQKKASYHIPKADIKISNLDPIFNTDKDYLASLPPPQLDLNINIAELETDVEDKIRLLLKGKLPHEVTKEDNIILGFDCEWSALSKYLTAEKPKVAVISLSDGDNAVLFRICNYGLSKDDLLGQLLLSESITKVGFKTHPDANKIYRDFNFLPENVVDLSYFTEASIVMGKLRNRIKVEEITAVLFGANIKRNRTLMLSNWSTSKGLSQEQAESAAYKAYYSYQANFKLKEIPSDIYSTIQL